MIKGVIFDVDGVLLNSMPVWENLGELYLDHLGIEAEKNLGETLFEMSLEEAADYLISHYNLEKTVEEVVQGLNKEVEDYLQTHHYKFTTVNDPQGKIADQWQVNVTPTIIILNKGKMDLATTGWTSYWGLKVRLFFTEFFG